VTLPQLKILPLGGLGEIGMNAMLVSYGRDAILIDCGVLFPDTEMLGIDIVIPDFSHFATLDIDLHGYMITHGHEDHIGALPYALSVRTAPIYASRFTCALIKQKLTEWNLKFSLQEVAPRETLDLGPFQIEFLRVTHSIPDGLALAIRTPLGTLIHTGDFKIDHVPLDGEKTDLARFSEYGEQGVLALFSDSTNSELEGTAVSETAIGTSLEAAMRDVGGRIFVAAFASHIHRIQQLCDLARKLDRYVFLNGRSMVQNIRLARELGILKAPDDLFIELAEAKELPVHKLMVLTTGSQAEPGSAIARLALADHPPLPINVGDVVIFSSRSIPGNERAISKAINGLMRQGAHVLYARASQLHTSGHAHKEEQRLMINLVKPNFFVPIHGELRHLSHHAKTARECGINEENIFVIEDGQTIIFEQTQNGIAASRGDKLEARKVFVDGKGVGDVGDIVMRDRQQLANAGIVICVLTLDLATGEIASGPDLICRGIIELEHQVPLLEEAKTTIEKALLEHTPQARKDPDLSKETIRLTLRRFFRKTLQRKPVVIPMVITV